MTNQELKILIKDNCGLVTKVRTENERQVVHVKTMDDFKTVKSALTNHQVQICYGHYNER